MAIDLRAWTDRLPPPIGPAGPLVPVLRLAGVIASVGLPLRGPALSLAALAGPIERAFALRGAAAVALVVNSPGGSPAQSALIANRIRQHADEKKLPVIAFVEDVAASGGYWLALAADEIYADATSIVGSIGVITSGFGFVGLLERLGIERRVHVQGERKSFLDPFVPEKTDDLARLERIQRELHGSFQAAVRARRGSKLAASESELFSGDFWTGTRARELGLIDGLGEIRGTLRARFGEKVRLRPVGAGGGWLRRRLRLAGPSAGEIAAELVAAAEARALWARYGL